MTQNEIIPLPQYLNASYEGDDLYTGKQLIEYAKLVAAKEREAIEKLQQHEDVLAPVGNSAWGEAYQEGWAGGTRAYLEAIRARGEQA